MSQVDMGGPNMDIESQREALSRATDFDLFLSSFLPADESHQSIDEVSADVDIQSAFDELRYLKQESVALTTARLVMTQILTNQPIEKVTTAKDVVLAEASLREGKEKLRVIKKKRNEADKRLPDLIEEVSQCVQQRDLRAAEVRRNILKEQAAVRSQQVREALERHDIDAIESLISHIDEVDISSCNEMLDFLRKEKAVANRDGTSCRTRVDTLLKEVEDDREIVQDKEDRASELESRIQSIDASIAPASAIRSEIALHEQLVFVLSSLGGLKIREIRRGGLSIAINAMLFVPNCSTIDRSRTTHFLDFEYGNSDGGENQEDTDLFDVMLQPADVSVKDLRNSDLRLVVQIVIRRLRDFMMDKHLPSE